MNTGHFIFLFVTGVKTPPSKIDGASWPFFLIDCKDFPVSNKIIVIIVRELGLVFQGEPSWVRGVDISFNDEYVDEISLLFKNFIR